MHRPVYMQFDVAQGSCLERGHERHTKLEFTITEGQHSFARRERLSNQNAEGYKQASSLVPNQLHQVSSGACHSPAGNTMAKP